MPEATWHISRRLSQDDFGRVIRQLRRFTTNSAFWTSIAASRLGRRTQRPLLPRVKDCFTSTLLFHT
ncbi:hypothetical protein AWB76_02441 [Caballeronia temeraria]|uniref:Uncharacterized protein n=1 Tax=Caballeronia temeraria TaxID=1777137 RepID=A0A158AHY9_9BURK|nr:hypothetical protein AWB76_02441 [Caballeronia temeraria]